MATLLTKDLTRESSATVEEKNLVITLTEDQRIEMRVKGTRSDPESIGILELYEMISETDQNSSRVAGGGKMISLNDLRSVNSISNLSYDDKVKFESIITRLLS